MLVVPNELHSLQCSMLITDKMEKIGYFKKRVIFLDSMTC